MKNKIKISSYLISTLLLISGCASKDLDRLTPNLNFNKNSKNLTINTFSVQKGDNLSMLIFNLNKKGFNIVEYPLDSDELIFDIDIKNININDALYYLNNKYDRKLYLKVSANSRLIYLKDKKTEIKKSIMLKNKEKIALIKKDIEKKKVFDIPIEVNQDISYSELFNNLRYLGFNIILKVTPEAKDENNSNDKKKDKIDVEELPSKNFSISTYTNQNSNNTFIPNGINVAGNTGNNINNQMRMIGNINNGFNNNMNNGFNNMNNGFNNMNNNMMNGIILTPPVFDQKSLVGKYKGSLLDLLSEIEHEYELFIDFEPVTKTITITDKKMKFYDLKLQPLQIQSSGKNMNGQTVDNLTNLVVDTIKPFEDLEMELRQMVSTKNIVLNRTNGTLSIYGNKGDLERTDIIIDKFNEIYGKSVVINFKIYEVQLNDKNQFGIDYSNIVKEYGKFAFNLNTNMTSSIISTNANGLTIQKTNGTSDNQNLNKGIFQFLNTFGKTTIVTRPILETINNLPVTMNITNSQDYVKSIEETITSDRTDTNGVIIKGEVSQNIKTDTIDTGFKLTLYPRIEKDGIKIALKPNISSLISLDKYEYGTETQRKSIQLKNTSHKDFTQNILIKPNETVMIGGYIIDKSKGDKNSLPMIGKENSFFDVIGSSKSRSIKKSELIFTISATIK